jgi:hypothetical protein
MAETMLENNTLEIIWFRVMASINKYHIMHQASFES